MIVFCFVLVKVVFVYLNNFSLYVFKCVLVINILLEYIFGRLENPFEACWTMMFLLWWFVFVSKKLIAFLWLYLCFKRCFSLELIYLHFGLLLLFVLSLIVCVNWWSFINWILKYWDYWHVLMWGFNFKVHSCSTI